MKIEFTITQRIQRPAAEVYDAIVNPEKLCRYFTETASGPLVTGAKVRWTWYGGVGDDCEVVEAAPHKRIVCRWKAFEVDDVTTCTFSLVANEDGSTTLRVHETGWATSTASLRSAFEHCAGWQHFALSLKAWIEHGVDLRGKPIAVKS